MKTRVKFGNHYAKDKKFARTMYKEQPLPEFWLQHEPDNISDPEAIIVFCGDKHVGYISREKEISKENRKKGTICNSEVLDLTNENVGLTKVKVENLFKWGGYLTIDYITPFERKMLISRDWGAFMEVRKDDKLNLTDDEKWIMKIINHNPIKNTIPLIDILNGDYTYEDVDRFICNFSKMHDEVFKVIKKEEK